MFSGITTSLRNPWFALVTLLIVLFFPLDIIDYLIVVIINFFVAVLNVVLWILVMLLNGVIWLLNTGSTAIIGGLDTYIDVIPTSESAPQLTTISYTNFTVAWVTTSQVNIFGTTTCLLTMILALVGLDFPIWG